MTLLPKYVSRVFTQADAGAGLRRALLWLALWLLPLSAFAQAELRTVALPLPDHYIIGLKPQAARLANEIGWQPAVGDIAYELDAVQGVELLHAYRQALRGFAVRATPAALKRLLADPRVEYVEPDALVWLNGMQSRPAVSWGLDRIDQRSPALDGRYSYYRTGAGVNVYVIDSGIYRGHAEFAGRVASGYAGIADGWGTGDCNGHGSHVSGTIGGASAGVASGVTLHPVRVFGCASSSPVSTVIAGIDWVAQHHVKPAVANLSFSTPLNTALNNAVAGLIERGVAAIVSSTETPTVYSCGSSPSSLPQTLAVGATDEEDFVAYYTFNDMCTNMYAPGSNIVSASHTHPTALIGMTGTSMAAAHVTGVAALYLSDDPKQTPEQLVALIQKSQTQVVRSLAFWGLGGLAYTQGNDLPRVVDRQSRGSLSMIMMERDVVVPESVHELIELELPQGWVAVSGGVRAGDLPSGHFITASYPRADGRAWVVSTREHLSTAPVKIRVWAMGIGSGKFSPGILSSYMRIARATSPAGGQVEATAYLPVGYTLVGGGFRTDTRGPGMIATGSWPVFPETGPRAPGWSASATQHMAISPGTIESFAIGIRESVPLIGRIDPAFSTAISDVDPSPATNLVLEFPSMLTGCGGRSLSSGVGSLLWRLQPFPDPVLANQSGCGASATQHLVADPASVQVWAIGVRVY